MYSIVHDSSEIQVTVRRGPVLQNPNITTESLVLPPDLANSPFLSYIFRSSEKLENDISTVPMKLLLQIGRDAVIL